MILPLQKFSTLLESMAAGVQGGSSQLVDLSVGSVLRALMEASAAVALWMQWLILQVLAMTRAATSTGADLDSWMGDFGLTRLPGAASVGEVTFSRYTAGVAATIPAGVVITTQDRNQSFAVVVQNSNAAWNGISGYFLAPSAGSVTVPVQAVLTGAGGNILPGAIGWLAAAIPGVDSVSNEKGFSGGSDPESDSALRTRFQLYINSRSQATLGAIAFAVESTQQGLRYTIIENTDAANQPQMGNLWVVVDDGSGMPPDTLLQAVSQSVGAVRPIGATYAVTGPGVISTSVAMVIATSSALTHAAVCANVEASIRLWAGALPIAGTLAVSKLEAIAHTVDPSVISVVSTLVNGAASDVTAGVNDVIILSSVVVS